MSLVAYNLEFLIIHTDVYNTLGVVSVILRGQWDTKIIKGSLVNILVLIVH